jgi:hypothetical protein
MFLVTPISINSIPKTTYKNQKIGNIRIYGGDILKELRCIWNSFLVVFPIVFIEGKQLDRLSQAFVLWTFVLVYFSIKTNSLRPEQDTPPDFYNRGIALFILISYIFASIDVRFLHLSDNIEYNARFYAGLIYLFLVIVKVYTLHAVNVPIRSRLITRGMRTAIINLCSAGILLMGQVFMNSIISLILILPAVALCLIPLFKSLFSQYIKLDSHNSKNEIY